MGVASKYGSRNGAATTVKSARVVVDYEGDVRQAKSGNWGFIIEPVYSDGTRGGFRDTIWIPLDEPSKLRSLRAALPRVAKQMDETDADFVADGEQTAWTPRPGAAAAQAKQAARPTPPTPPKQAVKVSSAVVKPSNGQVKPPTSNGKVEPVTGDMDAALVDMPF